MFRERKNVELTKKDLRGKKISGLHKNKNWNKLFGNLKSGEIKSLEKEILDNEKEYLNSIKREKFLYKEKDKYLKLILEVSHDVNSKSKDGNLELLDRYKEELLRINNELRDLELVLEDLLYERDDLNIKLLNLTINIGYSEISIREKRLEKNTSEIDRLVERLRFLREEKINDEKFIHETYTFLHRLLGNDLIEKIDSTTTGK